MNPNSGWTDKMLEEVAEAFKAMGNPVRIKILRRLSQSPATVGELVRDLGLPQSLTSQHLKILWSLHFLGRKRNGAHITYTLSRPEVLTIFSCLEKCMLPGPVSGNGESR
ncbi:MAG: metalloregulator ArsR/SmtB family transcription factor [Candidatus Brocadiia bacterium]